MHYRNLHMFYLSTHFKQWKIFEFRSFNYCHFYISRTFIMSEMRNIWTHLCYNCIITINFESFCSFPTSSWSIYWIVINCFYKNPQRVECVCVSVRVVCNSYSCTLLQNFILNNLLFYNENKRRHTYVIHPATTNTQHQTKK